MCSVFFGGEVNASLRVDLHSTSAQHLNSAFAYWSITVNSYIVRKRYYGKVMAIMTVSDRVGVVKEAYNDFAF